MATSFNVEQAIEKHIATIAADGNLLPDDVKELTSHLSDSIAMLSTQGLSAEEAFMVATKRLGTQQQVAKEYAKVNPSLKVNRIWVHLIFGFAAFTGLGGLFKALLVVVYGNALKSGEATPLSLLLVASVHLALCAAIGLLVYHKRAIAAYLQRKLQRRPLLMLVNAAILMTVAVSTQNAIELNTRSEDIRFIVLYELKNPYVEFTFYLLLFMLFVGVVSMFFTVRNPENTNLKRVFNRPSIWFLLVAGFATELLAASTRILPPQHAPLIAGLYFGAIYFMGAFVISYYNRSGVVKYLCWYGILGLALEIGAGIQADLSRLSDGYSVTTPYFVFGLLAGLAGGYIAGRFSSYRLSL